MSAAVFTLPTAWSVRYGQRPADLVSIVSPARMFAVFQLIFAVIALIDPLCVAVPEVVAGALCTLLVEVRT